MARTTVATDDFADGVTGADWLQMNVDQAGSIVASGTGAAGQFGLQASFYAANARWQGAGSFTADQYSTVTLTVVDGDFGAATAAGVIVRGSGTGTNNNTRTCYEVYVVHNGTSGQSIVLQKWVTGTRTALTTNTSQDWANNDTITLEATGTSTTTLSVYRNSTLVFTHDDSSSPITTAGAPGVSATSSAVIDNWDGGNITAGAAVLMGQCCT